MSSLLVFGRNRDIDGEDLGMRLRAPLRVIFVVCALTSTLVASGFVAAADANAKTYVALGDSYTAGPVIPLQEEPWGCLKSTNNYPKVMARRLGLPLRDASCSGAETEDMENEQGVSPEANPPQFDRLDRKVAIVSLQIGGNDIGFSGIAETCTRAAFERKSCRSKYQHDGSDGHPPHDVLLDRIAAAAPDVAAAIQGIHQRAPRADVFLLGYPGIFKIGVEDPSCPAMGVGKDDAIYLRGIQEALNAMIAEQAAANGADYVDVYAASAGKTACDLPVLRWVEPIVPVNAAAPIHPNINGMLGMASVLEEAVSKKAGSGLGVGITAP